MRLLAYIPFLLAASATALPPAQRDTPVRGDIKSSPEQALNGTTAAANDMTCAILYNWQTNKDGSRSRIIYQVEDKPNWCASPGFTITEFYIVENCHCSFYQDEKKNHWCTSNNDKKARVLAGDKEHGGLNGKWDEKDNIDTVYCVEQP